MKRVKNNLFKNYIMSTHVVILLKIYLYEKIHKCRSVHVSFHLVTVHTHGLLSHCTSSNIKTILMNQKFHFGVI